MVRIESYSVTQADLDASDHILDTFIISPETVRPDESESEGMIAGTLDDIDVHLTCSTGTCRWMSLRSRRWFLPIGTTLRATTGSWTMKRSVWR
jgi:hypothetical protein